MGGEKVPFRIDREILAGDLPTRNRTWATTILSFMPFKIINLRIGFYSVGDARRWLDFCTTLPRERYVFTRSISCTYFTFRVNNSGNVNYRYRGNTGSWSTLTNKG